MSEKTVRILAVHPVHPHRGEPSFIEATVILEYLKGTPIASVRLTPEEALVLIEQLAVAIRVTA